VKSLLQLLAHRAGHKVVSEGMVTELHGRLWGWQCGRQPATQADRAMHNVVPTCARDTVDSEAPKRFLVAVVPRCTPDVGGACLNAMHTSAEAVTDESLATGSLLHVLAVPLTPRTECRPAAVCRAPGRCVVCANCQGLAHSVTAPDEALAE
jgi:hypothetical protein